MKISKYTFLFDIDNIEYYIYSTLSNALVEIDEESYLFLFNTLGITEISRNFAD